MVVRGSSLEGALAKVDNLSNYGLVDDVSALGASYEAAISQAHCFKNGNKRTVFQALDLVLDPNGALVRWDT